MSLFHTNIEDVGRAKTTLPPLSRSFGLTQSNSYLPKRVYSVNVLRARCVDSKLHVHVSTQPCTANLGAQL